MLYFLSTADDIMKTKSEEITEFDPIVRFKQVESAQSQSPAGAPPSTGVTDYVRFFNLHAIRILI